MNEAEKKFFELMGQGVFEIDSEGRIWRKAVIKHGQGRNKRLCEITPKRLECTDTHGYLYISLKYDGKAHNIRAHRLVWMHFFGEIPEDKEINHKYGVKTDNRPGELELMTRSQNIQHAWRIGINRAVVGEASNLAKLTEKQVLEIRQRYTRRPSNRRLLAEEYNISLQNISNIIRYRTWKHVEPGIPVSLPVTMPMSETVEAV